MINVNEDYDYLIQKYLNGQTSRWEENILLNKALKTLNEIDRKMTDRKLDLLFDDLKNIQKQIDNMEMGK